MLSDFCVECLKCNYEYEVIIGLWQSTYANKKRLKKTFSELENKVLTAILKSLSKHAGQF